MIRTAFIEDYLKKHPGSTISQISVELGYVPNYHIGKLERLKMVYWRIDLRDGKTKHFYLRKKKEIRS